MSERGVKLAAEVLSVMQRAKIELIGRGAEYPALTSGQQDILLGHLFTKANDAIKDEFAKIISMPIEPDSKANKPLRAWWRKFLEF